VKSEKKKGPFVCPLAMVLFSFGKKQASVKTPFVQKGKRKQGANSGQPWRKVIYRREGPLGGSK